ncbi:heavy metal-associated isoprenylated plant protein 16-like [Cornus florida]|uniref:heavy metal-associated isoprenylated plant protein 16-like n=1 Tax=Cornus florida TaxID=4283 RepID=UPI0028A06655|nr:heavy metal-associated isoprenylated plant protein 16-like [Cornus florida]
MKQKVVIKVSMHCQKERTKAMKIAVGVSGVETLALKGEDMNQIEVTGDGIDAVSVTKLLRKKMGYAELVSVGPVGQKKPQDTMKVTVQPQVWPPYSCGHKIWVDEPNCSIM